MQRGSGSALHEHVPPAVAVAYSGGVAPGASLATAARLSILVIDDDADVREFLRDFLTLEGFEVTTLADRSLAIEWIRHEMFHLIMLDLMMPKIYGLDLLPQIRAVDENLPVIIMCSVPSAETERESIRLGVSAYMSYPFLGDELRAALARITESTRLSPRGASAPSAARPRVTAAARRAGAARAGRSGRRPRRGC